MEASRSAGTPRGDTGSGDRRPHRREREARHPRAPRHFVVRARPRRRRARDPRGRAGRRQDHAGQGARALGRRAGSRARSSRPTCCRPTSPASSVFNQRTNEFEFRPGPVFPNLLLADEINRASPRTQAALLECMEEGQVTVDGVTHALDAPFIVIATQNPIEYEGTYPLPEAQLDRFMMLLRARLPGARRRGEDARRAGAGRPARRRSSRSPRPRSMRGAIEAAKALHVEEGLTATSWRCCATRAATAGSSLGASPRAGIARACGSRRRGRCSTAATT